MPGHIHAQTEEAHALTTQTRAMAGESRKPIRTHDSMARRPRIVARAHDIPDRAGGQGSTGEHSDEAVGRDAPRRDPLYDAAHGACPRVRDQSPFPPTGTSSIESDMEAMSGRARRMTSRTRSSLSEASCAARSVQTSVIHAASGSLRSRLIT